ncbi:hypothetical protein M4D81_03690 [Paenibacillus sp. p3-SID867]|uniref:hypothetical protein n=1 Tax=Paenibacillus sp. p3-SID867 TaxID=2916363 RepID=UPI0021A34AE5|nr:hypothetical protein [Paenibacillus sp. p3-SID867]MCT1398102.1 hypothetical protein [Paenibacillus sp. p3-SID867]
MNSQETNQMKVTNRDFTLVWNGGFSYLTYLKKKSHVTLSNDNLIIRAQNYILGAFPSNPKTSELPLTNIRKVSVGSKLNWFDMVFAILFAIVTLITMSFWPLLLTALFLLRTFNTTISITDSLGNRVNILSGSKGAANQFAEVLTRTVNQCTEAASSNELQTNDLNSPLTPLRESNKKKTIFMISSAAALALLILVVAIFSKGGFDNKYVQWVKEGTAIPGKPYAMQEVLENKEIFSNVEWSQVVRNGNQDDIDKFVKYESTYSDQGVSVHIRSILQVFGPDQFEPVEFSVNGEKHELPDWTLLLVEAADTYERKQPLTETEDPVQKPSASTIQEAPQDNQSTVPTKQTNSQEDAGTVQNTSDISLMNFLIWDTLDEDKEIPLNLDGEKASVVIGSDTPNGINLRVFIDSMETGWRLELPANEDGPFDEFGDLKSGFSLYLKEHDFDNDGTPEVVVAASNQADQTFVWVFGYNFVALEYGTSPLELLMNAEGQSDIYISNNKITLPYGSQGLFEEYTYTNGIFTK